MGHGRGWISRVTKKIEPAPAVTFEGKCEMPSMITLAMIPFAPGADSIVAPEIVHRSQDGTDMWECPHSSGSITIQSSLNEISVS